MPISKILSWTAVILWMFLIFHLSSQVAEESNQLSTGITRIIVETVERIVPQENLDIEELNHIVRKNSHFFAYLVLGILMLNSLRRSGISGYSSIVLALLFCVLYAITDEVHQLFVPGRGGQVKDVIIDSSGVIAGIGMYFFIRKILR